MTAFSNSSPPTSHRRRHFGGDQSGAAMVEFALVVGLFAFLLYGLIAFGMVLATKQRITNAAAEAARSAVGVPDAATAESTATDRVTRILGAPNGRYTVTPVGAACDPLVPLGPQCITVTVTWDYKNHPVVPPAPGLGLIMPESFGSAATVQFK
ncbi:MAG: pilus assembly protein [Actinomycetota bacterium]|nr:pilus assembly protein [Actinomycetota bacterium]